MGKYSIIIVFGLTIVLFTYSYSLRNTFFTGDQRTVEMYEYNQAHNIAQGALMTAIKDLKTGSSNLTIPAPGDTSTTAFATWPDMKGDYSIHMWHDTIRGLLIVESTGRFDGSEYTVAAGLRSGGAGSFNWPNLDNALSTEGAMYFSNGKVIGDVFSGGKITLGGNSKIYGSVTAAAEGYSFSMNSGYITGNLYTNSTSAGGVEFTNWGGEIGGDLFVGPGGDPFVVVKNRRHNIRDHFKNGATLGSLDSKIPPQEFPMPVFPVAPDISTTLLDVDLRGNSSQNIDLRTIGNANISNIDVRSNTVLNIIVGDQDRVLKVNNFNMPQGHVNIISEGNGRLQLIVDNSFNISGGSSMNNNPNPGGNEQKPQSLLIAYGGEGEFSIAGGIRVNANLFVEQADIKLTGGGNVRGNIISGGENITVSGGSENESRLVYAPNAHVKMTGSGTIYGAMVAKSFNGAGNATIDYSEDYENFLPELDSDNIGSSGYSIAFWN